MLSFPAILVGVLLLLLYWMYWRRSHRRMLELAAKVPGPPAWPMVGNALLFMARPEEQLNKIAALLKEYGQYVRFWLGPDLNIIVSNPKDIRLLLTSNRVNQKGPVYDHMRELIGPGILTGGATWRNHRKIATPSYNKKSVQHFSTIFNKEAEALAQRLCRKGDETFNVYEDVLHCTTQSVCQTLMGLSKEDAMNVYRMDEVVEMTPTLYSLIFSKMTRWWLQIPLIFWLTGGKMLEDYMKKAIDDMTADILRKRQRALERDGIMHEDALGIVDRYILSGDLNDQEIKWETFTLFTTSQEASAKIASAVLLFLAHLPEWQDKVFNEITELLGSDDGYVTEDQLKKFQYLDMVYKEALRYLSIAALIQRTVEEEVAIDDGKITLPVGTSLAIPIHILHRDPRYWEDADQVRPERFHPDEVKKRDPNAFVPFSLGAMDCLGRVYATTLIKTLVVRVLRQVKFHAEGRLSDLDIHVAISVKFAKGYHVKASRRKIT